MPDIEGQSVEGNLTRIKLPN